MYIQVSLCPHPYVWCIPCKVKMGLFSTFFYNDIPVIYHKYPMDKHDISKVYHYKKRYGTNPFYFTWYTPYIWMRTPYAFDIHGIYHVYTMYIPCIYPLYTCWYCLNLLFSGFCGTHRPNAPPSHGTADNVPDQHNEADFDIPNTQSVLETFICKLSKQTDDEYQSLSALLFPRNWLSGLQTTMLKS